MRTEWGQEIAKQVVYKEPFVYKVSLFWCLVTQILSTVVYSAESAGDPLWGKDFAPVTVLPFR